jgi:hypothetical protein
MGWRWEGWTETWYWDQGDNDGPPPWETEPSVMLMFTNADPQTLEVVLAACRNESGIGYVTRGGGATASAPALRAIPLLRRLEDRGIHPTKVSVRAADLLPEQVEEIRRAVGTGSALEIIG